MPRGGKREGAGRKKEKRTIQSEKAREYLINRIAAELEPIVTAQIEAAKGMWIDELDPNGERIRVYRKLPDLKTGEYLLNQEVGKPAESLDITTQGEKLNPFTKEQQKRVAEKILKN